MRKLFFILFLLTMSTQCGIVKDIKVNREIHKLQLENEKLKAEAYRGQIKTSKYQREKVDSIVAVYANIVNNDTTNSLYPYFQILENIQKKLHNIQNSLELLNIEDLEGEVIEKFNRYTAEREQYLNTMDLVLYHIDIGFSETKNDSIFFDDGSWEIKLSGKKYIKDYINQRKDIYFDSLSIGVNITSIGYSDSNPCAPSLAIKILNQTNKQLPNNNISDNNQKYKYNEENRKFVNLLLSRLRAEAVKTYMIECLKEINNDIMIKDNVIARGETYPDKNIKYNIQDDRRRICIYSITIIPKYE